MNIAIPFDSAALLILFGLVVGWFVGYLEGYRRALTDVRENLLTRKP